MPELERKPYVFKTPFGFEFQLMPVHVWLLGFVIVGATALFLYQKLYDDPERELISQKEINKQLAAEVEEYSLHAMEEPERHELLEDQDGKLIVRVYKDHCVLIQRQSVRGVRSKLVIDLARAPLNVSTRMGDWPTPSIVPVVTEPVGPHRHHVSLAMDPCRGGCLNPHPGKFEWKYGAQAPGGWIEVWRRWSEGCEHVQMFHPQSGSWATNADGSPQVRWTCCVH